MTTRLPTLGGPPKAGIRRWLDSSFGDVVRRLNASSLHRRGRWVDVNEDFGADPTGNKDSTSAFRRMFNEVRQFSGPTRVVCAGDYLLDDVGMFSQHNSETGDFGGTFAHSLIIDAWGATFEHTGDGHMFEFWGHPGQDRRIVWLGGRLRGNASTKSLIRARDCSRFWFQPEALEDASTGRGLLLQNWRSWCENVTIGWGGVIQLSGNKHGIDLQGASAAGTYEGSSAPASEESFARLRCANLFADGVADKTADGIVLLIQGNTYNSMIRDICGNVANEGGSLIYRTGGVHRMSVIENILFEGADDSGEAVSTAVKIESATTGRFTIRNVQWTGGFAIPVSGNMHEGGDPISVTLSNGVATTIIAATHWSGSTTALVHIKAADNSVRGSAIVQRRQGAATLDIDSLATTGITFSQSAGALQATQSSGSDVDVSLSLQVLRAG